MSGASDSLDAGRLAEEIEDLDRRDVREAERLLRQMFLHALKIAFDPASDANRHWRGEILTFQDDASRAFTPSMRHRIDADELWRKAVRSFLAGSLPQAARDLDWLRGMSESPLGVAELASPDFDLDAVLGTISARRPQRRRVRTAAGCP